MIQFESIQDADKAADQFVAMLEMCRQHLPGQVYADLENMIKSIMIETAKTAKQSKLLMDVLEALGNKVGKMELDSQRLDALAEYGCHSIHFIKRDRLALEPGQTLRMGCDILIAERKAQDKAKG